MDAELIRLKDKVLSGESLTDMELDYILVNHPEFYDSFSDADEDIHKGNTVSLDSLRAEMSK